MYKRCQLILFPLLLCLAAQNAAAQVNLGRVVVTATQDEQDLSSLPAAVSVIDSEELSQLPGKTLDEKLASVPGVNAFRQSGVLSFSAVVSLRGMGTSEQGRSLVLLDGIPINTSATGSVNWNRLKMEEIDRVEIFKGPASSLYGSNAVGGVINIISKKSLGTDKATVRADYGTFNTYSGKALAGNDNGKFYVLGSAYGLHSEGYVVTPQDQRTAYTVKSNVSEGEGGIKAGYKFSPDNVLEAAYSYYDGLFGEGTKIQAPDGNTRSFKTGFTRVSWQGKKESLSWQANGFHQQEQYGRVSESMGASYKRIDTDGSRIDQGINAGMGYEISPALKLSAGADLKSGSVDTTDSYKTAPYADIENIGKLHMYSPYLHAEYSALDGRLKALGGLRYDYAKFTDGYYNNPTNPNWGSVNGPLPEHDWDRFSPSASVGWVYREGVQHYVSYAQGFRAPNLEDLCLSLQRGSRVTVANPNLSPETVTTWETGMRISSIDGLYLEPAAYFTKGKEFIYEVNTGQTININGNKPIYKKQNVSEVEIYGAEMELRYAILKGLSVQGSYTYTHSRITDYAGDSSLEGKALAYNPASTAYAGFDWQNPFVNLSGWWRYKDGQYTDDANTLTVGAYSTLSAKIWKDITPSLTGSLSVENILDDRFLESESSLAPGRVITAAVSFSF